MQKFDIIKIQRQVESAYLELRRNYSQNEEMNELKLYYKKILELLNKLTIKEISGENEFNKKT